MNKQIQPSQIIILATNPQKVVINMVWGARGLGILGYAISFAFSKVNKQMQFSEIIILATNLQNIVIHMVWGTRGHGILGICNFPCISNDKPSEQILQIYNPNHQTTKYIN